jgi:hypothetical protein
MKDLSRLQEGNAWNGLLRFLKKFTARATQSWHSGFIHGLWKNGDKNSELMIPNRCTRGRLDNSWIVTVRLFTKGSVSLFLFALGTDEPAFRCSNRRSSARPGGKWIFWSFMSKQKVLPLSWMFLSIYMWTIANFRLGIGAFSNAAVERWAFLAKRNLVTSQKKWALMNQHFVGENTFEISIPVWFSLSVARFNVSVVTHGPDTVPNVVRTLAHRFLQSTLQKDSFLNVSRLSSAWKCNSWIRTPLLDDSHVFMTVVFTCTPFWQVD